MDDAQLQAMLNDFGFHDWIADCGLLTCPDGYTIELDGTCPDGCVSPLRRAGLV